MPIFWDWAAFFREVDEVALAHTIKVEAPTLFRCALIPAVPWIRAGFIRRRSRQRWRA